MMLLPMIFAIFSIRNTTGSDASILERYKRYNNMENNTPIIGGGSLDYSPIGSTTPDNEDVNEDKTVSSLEQYYQYEIDLDPDNNERRYRLYCRQGNRRKREKR